MGHSYATRGWIGGSKTAFSVGLARGAAGGVAGMLFGTSIVLGGPVNLARIPADARTIIHFDIEAAVGSAIGQFMLEECDKLDMDTLKNIEQEIGLDPLVDIFDITIVYSGDGEDVVIATTSDRVDDALVAIKDEIGTEGFQTRRVGEREMIVMDDRGKPLFVWVEPSGPRRLVVAGHHAERVAGVVSLIEGEGESLLGSDSLLADAGIHDGTLVFVATLDAGEFAERSPLLTLFGEATAVVVQAGEGGGRAFADVLIEVDDEMAAQIATMAAGGVAFAQLHTQKKEMAAEIKDARAELLSAIKIDSGNGNVQVSFQYNIEEFVELLRRAIRK